MEPALDVLWYKLDNFTPLVLCMPRDLYKEVVWQVDPEDDNREEISTLVSNGFLFIPQLLTINRSLFKGQC
jgi:hypothetical protein